MEKEQTSTENRHIRYAMKGKKTPCRCRLCQSSISLPYSYHRDARSRIMDYKREQEKGRTKSDIEKNLDWLCNELRKNIQECRRNREKKAENDLVQGFSKLQCTYKSPEEFFASTGESSRRKELTQLEN